VVGSTLILFQEAEGSCWSIPQKQWRGGGEWRGMSIERFLYISIEWRRFLFHDYTSSSELLECNLLKFI
jgi:hypothetical protein